MWWFGNWSKSISEFFYSLYVSAKLYIVRGVQFKGLIDDQCNQRTYSWPMCYCMLLLVMQIEALINHYGYKDHCNILGILCGFSQGNAKLEESPSLVLNCNEKYN